MTHKAISVNDYQFNPDDKLLLDTNIWLLVYGPQKPRDTRVATYSQALANILSAKCCVYIDVLIVSEFINTYARLKWKLIAPKIKYFKKFRNSPSFKPVAKDIASDVKRVLDCCTRIENDFDILDVNDVINQYATGNADFNDQMIAILCKRKGLKLVTDDSDFGGQGISVVTANRRLLE